MRPRTPTRTRAVAPKPNDDPETATGWEHITPEFLWNTELARRVRYLDDFERAEVREDLARRPHHREERVHRHAVLELGARHNVVGEQRADELHQHVEDHHERRGATRAAAASSRDVDRCPVAEVEYVRVLREEYGAYGLSICMES